ncbi:MAG TPA: DUF3618 domain-containing protein [Nocardioidaceae bacterium]|nr:DUF3618 domain-containing protein [Nocardioidaceae bacterium]
MGQATEERLMVEIAGTREDLSQDLDALADKVSPSRVMERKKAAARGRLRSLRDNVMGSADSARSSVTGTASGAADAVSGTAQSAVGTIERRTEGSPLAAGAIAFGAGWLLSALLPATEKEKQAAGALMEQSQPLVDEAKSMGQDVAGNLKESASQAAQEFKETAQEAAEHVKAEGTHAADEVKQQAP